MTFREVGVRVTAKGTDKYVKDITKANKASAKFDQQLRDTVGSVNAAVNKGGLDKLSDGFTSAADDFDKAAKKFNNTSGNINKTSDNISGAAKNINSSVKGITDSTKQLNDAAKSFGNPLRQIQENNRQIIESGISQGIIGAVRGVEKIGGQIFNDIRRAFDFGKSVLSIIFGPFIRDAEAGIESVRNIGKAVTDELGNPLDGLSGAWDNFLENSKGVGRVISIIGRSIADIATLISAALVPLGILPASVALGVGAASAAVDGLAKSIASAGQQTSEFGARVTSSTTGLQEATRIVRESEDGIEKFGAVATIASTAGAAFLAGITAFQSPLGVASREFDMVAINVGRAESGLRRLNKTISDPVSEQLGDSIGNQVLSIRDLDEELRNIFLTTNVADLGPLVRQYDLTAKRLAALRRVIRLSSDVFNVPDTKTFVNALDQVEDQLRGITRAVAAFQSRVEGTSPSQIAFRQELKENSVPVGTLISNLSDMSVLLRTATGQIENFRENLTDNEAVQLNRTLSVTTRLLPQLRTDIVTFNQELRPEELAGYAGALASVSDELASNIRNIQRLNRTVKSPRVDIFIDELLRIEESYARITEAAQEAVDTYKDSISPRDFPIPERPVTFSTDAFAELRKFIENAPEGGIRLIDPVTLQEDGTNIRLFLDQVDKAIAARRFGESVGDAFIDNFVDANLTPLREFADKVADLFVGTSPPPEGPLKDIDKGGRRTAEAWVAGFVGADFAKILGNIGRVIAGINAFTGTIQLPSAIVLGPPALAFAALGQAIIGADLALHGLTDSKLVAPFVEGIVKVLGDGVNTVKSFASNVADLLIGRSPPPEGPLSKLDEGGRKAAESWVGAFVDVGIFRTILDLPGKVFQGLTSIVKGILSVPGRLVEQFQGDFEVISNTSNSLGERLLRLGGVGLRLFFTFSSIGSGARALSRLLDGKLAPALGHTISSLFDLDLILGSPLLRTAFEGIRDSAVSFGETVNEHAIKPIRKLLTGTEEVTNEGAENFLKIAAAVTAIGTAVGGTVAAVRSPGFTRVLETVAADGADDVARAATRAPTGTTVARGVDELSDIEESLAKAFEGLQETLDNFKNSDGLRATSEGFKDINSSFIDDIASVERVNDLFSKVTEGTRKIVRDIDPKDLQRLSEEFSDGIRISKDGFSKANKDVGDLIDETFRLQELFKKTDGGGRIISVIDPEELKRIEKAKDAIFDIRSDAGQLFSQVGKGVSIGAVPPKEIVAVFDGIAEAGAGTSSSFIQSFINAPIEAVRSFADRIGRFFIGESPPPEGPLSQIEEGGRKTAEAFVEGFASADPSSAVEAIAKPISDAARERERVLPIAGISVGAAQQFSNALQIVKGIQNKDLALLASGLSQVVIEIDLLLHGLRDSIAVIPFVGGLIIAGEKIVDTARDIAQRVSDLLVGRSPPPKGPLKDIDKGGRKTGEAWSEGLKEGLNKNVEGDIGNFGRTLLGFLGGTSLLALPTTFALAGGGLGIGSLILSLTELDLAINNISGSKLVIPFIEGLRNTFESGVNTVRGFAERIANLLVGKSPPPEGPLSKIDEGGRKTAEAWVDGFNSADFDSIDENITGTSKTIESQANEVEKSGGSIIESIAKIGLQIFGLNAIANSVFAKLPETVTPGSGLIVRILAGIIGAGAIDLSLGSPILKGIGSVLGGIASGVGNIVSGFVDTVIINPFNSISGFIGDAFSKIKSSLPQPLQDALDTIGNAVGSFTTFLRENAVAVTAFVAASAGIVLVTKNINGLRNAYASIQETRRRFKAARIIEDLREGRIRTGTGEKINPEEFLAQARVSRFRQKESADFLQRELSDIDRINSKLNDAAIKASKSVTNLGSVPAEALDDTFNRFAKVAGVTRKASESVSDFADTHTKAIVAVQQTNSQFSSVTDLISTGIENTFGKGIQAARGFAQGVANLLRGSSPPPEGPLSDIDIGGRKVALAWIDGFLSVDISPISVFAQDALSEIEDIFNEGAVQTLADSIVIGDDISAFQEDALKSFIDTVSYIGTGIEPEIDLFADKFKSDLADAISSGKFEEFQVALNVKLEEALNNGLQVENIESIREAINEAIADIDDLVPVTSQASLSRLRDSGVGLGESYAEGLVEGAMPDIDQLAQYIQDNLGGSSPAKEGPLSSFDKDAMALGQTWTDGFGGSIREGAKETAEGVNEEFDKIRENINKEEPEQRQPGIFAGILSAAFSLLGILSTVPLAIAGVRAVFGGFRKIVTTTAAGVNAFGNIAKSAFGVLAGFKLGSIAPQLDGVSSRFAGIGTRVAGVLPALKAFGFRALALIGPLKILIPILAGVGFTALGLGVGVSGLADLIGKLALPAMAAFGVGAFAMGVPLATLVPIIGGVGIGIAGFARFIQSAMLPLLAVFGIALIYIGLRASGMAVTFMNASTAFKSFRVILTRVSTTITGIAIPAIRFAARSMLFLTRAFISGAKAVLFFGKVLLFPIVTLGRLSLSLIRAIRNTRLFQAAMRAGGKIVRGFGSLLSRVPGLMAAVGVAAGLAAVAIGVFVAAVAVAFKLGERGENFRGIISGANLAGISLNKLRASAAGLVSDIELLQIGTKAVQGFSGVVQKEFGEALPKFLEISRSIARQTGADFKETFEGLVQGARRGSTRLLKSVGVVINAADAYQTYADRVGIAVEQLNSEDKQIAIIDATLARHSQLVEGLARTEETAAEKRVRSQVRVTNAFDKAALAVQPLYEILVDTIDLGAQIVEALVPALSTISIFIADLLKRLGALFGPLINSIGNTIGTIFDFIFTFGRKILGGFAQVIGTFIGLLDVTFGTAFDRIKGFLESIGAITIGSSPPDEGPLKDIDTGAEAVAQAWIDGFSSADIASHVEGITDDVRDTLRQLGIGGVTVPTTDLIQDQLGEIANLSLPQVERAIARLDKALQPFSDNVAIINARFQDLAKVSDKALEALDRQIEASLQAVIDGDQAAAVVLRNLDRQREAILARRRAHQGEVDQANIALELGQAQQAQARALLEIRRRQLGTQEDITKETAKERRAAAKRDRAASSGSLGPRPLAPDLGFDGPVPDNLSQFLGTSPDQTGAFIQEQYLEGLIRFGRIETITPVLNDYLNNFETGARSYISEYFLSQAGRGTVHGVDARDIETNIDNFVDDVLLDPQTLASGVAGGLLGVLAASALTVGTGGVAAIAGGGAIVAGAISEFLRNREEELPAGGAGLGEVGGINIFDAARQNIDPQTGLPFDSYASVISGGLGPAAGDGQTTLLGTFQNLVDRTDALLTGKDGLTGKFTDAITSITDLLSGETGIDTVFSTAIDNMIARISGENSFQLAFTTAIDNIKLKLSSLTTSGGAEGGIDPFVSIGVRLKEGAINEFTTGVQLVLNFFQPSVIVGLELGELAITGLATTINTELSELDIAYTIDSQFAVAEGALELLDEELTLLDPTFIVDSQLTVAEGALELLDSELELLDIAKIIDVEFSIDQVAISNLNELLLLVDLAKIIDVHFAISPAANLTLTQLIERAGVLKIISVHFNVSGPAIEVLEGLLANIDVPFRIDTTFKIANGAIELLYEEISLLDPAFIIDSTFTVADGALVLLAEELAFLDPAFIVHTQFAITDSAVLELETLLDLVGLGKVIDIYFSIDEVAVRYLGVQLSQVDIAKFINVEFLVDQVAINNLSTLLNNLDLAHNIDSTFSVAEGALELLQSELTSLDPAFVVDTTLRLDDFAVSNLQDQIDNPVAYGKGDVSYITRVPAEFSLESDAFSKLQNEIDAPGASDEPIKRLFLPSTLVISPSIFHNIQRIQESINALVGADIPLLSIPATIEFGGTNIVPEIDTGAIGEEAESGTGGLLGTLTTILFNPFSIVTKYINSLITGEGALPFGASTTTLKGSLEGIIPKIPEWLGNISQTFLNTLFWPISGVVVLTSDYLTDTSVKTGFAGKLSTFFTSGESEQGTLSWLIFQGGSAFNRLPVLIREALKSVGSVFWNTFGRPIISVLNWVIDRVNEFTSSINAIFNTLNPLGFLGVEAPQIGQIDRISEALPDILRSATGASSGGELTLPFAQRGGLFGPGGLVVGEAGPEIIIPSQRIAVLPNTIANALNGGQGVTPQPYGEPVYNNSTYNSQTYNSSQTDNRINSIINVPNRNIARRVRTELHTMRAGL